MFKEEVNDSSVFLLSFGKLRNLIFLMKTPPHLKSITSYKLSYAKVNEIKIVAFIKNNNYIIPCRIMCLR